MPSLSTEWIAIIAASSRPRRSSSCDLAGVLADQLDPDAGVPGEHVGDQPRAGVQPGGAEHAEPDRPGLEGLHALRRPPGVLGRGQRPLGVRAQRVGDGRRYDAAPDPAEQLDAERLLERPDLLGDRRLGVAELLGRRGQRPVLVDARKQVSWCSEKA